MHSTTTPARVGDPACGNAGWGCPDLAYPGQWLSDGYPTAADARWAAEQALALPATSPLPLSEAQQLVAALYKARSSYAGMPPLNGRPATIVWVPAGHSVGTAAKAAGLPAEHSEYSTGYPAGGPYWLVVDEAAPEQLLPGDDPAPLPRPTNPLQRWAAEQAVAHLCTCEWEDTGTGETGPQPHISSPDEGCPEHGRTADPEGWAEAEAHERGYVLSGVRQCLPAEAGISVEGNEALVMALYEVAEQLQHPDDAHGTDKAIAHVAQVLVVLHTGSEPEPTPCLGHLVRTPVHQP